MAVVLTKNNPVSLTKLDPNLKKLHIGLGWDAELASGAKVDLDLSLFITDANKQTLSDKHMIYYHQATSICGAIQYHGDNKTGAGETGVDKETADIDLTTLQPEGKRVFIAASIHDFDKRQQNFGLVKNAFLRVVNKETGVELARAKLTDNFPTDTALILGELYITESNDWDINILSQGYSNGLGGVVLAMGLEVA